jgi:hypothetical protein
MNKNNPNQIEIYNEPPLIPEETYKDAVSPFLKDAEKVFSRTVAAINVELPDKEYILQYNKRGWRCISWYPHCITTNWVKSKKLAISDGDRAIKEYYAEK